MTVHLPILQEVPPPSPVTKRCRHCELEKPLEEFYRGKGSQGRQAYCKICDNAIRLHGRRRSLRLVPPENRDQFRSRRLREQRAVTVNMQRLPKRDLAFGRLLYPETEGLDVARPRTRADCVDGIRPCPFVSCRYHLYLDVLRETHSIKLNFPDLEPDELEHTCALDVADQGGATLEDVAAWMNVTRERIRQIELVGLRKMRIRGRKLGEHVVEEGGRREDNEATNRGASLRSGPAEQLPLEDYDDTESTAGYRVGRVSFFSDDPLFTDRLLAINDRVLKEPRERWRSPRKEPPMTDLHEAVKDALTKAAMTAAEISERIHVDVKPLGQALYQLKLRGEVRATGTKGSYVYELTGERRNGKSTALAVAKPRGLRKPKASLAPASTGGRLAELTRNATESVSTLADAYRARANVLQELVLALQA